MKEITCYFVKLLNSKIMYIDFGNCLKMFVFGAQTVELSAVISLWHSRACQCQEGKIMIFLQFIKQNFIGGHLNILATSNDCIL